MQAMDSSARFTLMAEAIGGMVLTQVTVSQRQPHALVIIFELVVSACF